MLLRWSPERELGTDESVDGGAELLGAKEHLRALSFTKRIAENIGERGADSLCPVCKMRAPALRCCTECMQTPISDSF